MTKVAILPIPTSSGKFAYQAVAGDKQAEGRTAGEALDALTRQLSEEESGTLVIVQNWSADRFFTSARQRRLEQLMRSWRDARDSGKGLTPDEQAELEQLAEAELRGSVDRSRGLLEELGQ